MLPDLVKNAQLTIDELVPKNKLGLNNPNFPYDGRCKTGHIVPPNTRFFYISGTALSMSRWGTYCEHCLTIANSLATKQKEAKLNGDTKLDELLYQIEKDMNNA